MELKCSIIEDLLPSYVDGICSKDTKELVENHLAGCEQCMQKRDQMKNTSIVSGTAQKSQVNFMKKVKNKILYRVWAGKIMMALVLLMWAMLLVGKRFMGLWPSAIFMLLMLIAMGIAGRFDADGSRKRIAAEGIISWAVFVYMVILNEYCRVSLAADTSPFGVEWSAAGPLVEKQCYAMMLISGVILLWNIFGKYKNAFASMANIMTLGMVMNVEEWMYRMDSFESVMKRIRTGDILMVSMLAVCLAGYVLYRRFKKAA